MVSTALRLVTFSPRIMETFLPFLLLCLAVETVKVIVLLHALYAIYSFFRGALKTFTPDVLKCPKMAWMLVSFHELFWVLPRAIFGGGGGGGGVPWLVTEPRPQR